MNEPLYLCSAIRQINNQIYFKIDEILYHIALSKIEGIGNISAKRIVGKLNSVESVFLESEQSLIHQFDLQPQLAKRIVTGRDAGLKRADAEICFIERNGIRAIPLSSNDYPARLRECPDSPTVIFTLGNMALNAPRMVAVVGTRRATNYGKRLCSELVEGLADYGVSVVSGLAYGIDITAHKTSLKHNMSTIGVLAHGLDRLYPAAHRDTGKKMLDNGGLLTEYLSNTIPDRENFPKRNRIVAGMTDATIVIESAAKGGSLITAYLAADYHRDVFAFPGKVFDEQSSGTNLLIKKHRAQLIESVDDFIVEMGWKKVEKAVVNTEQKVLHGTKKQVYDFLLTNGEVGLDDISISCNIQTSDLSVTLLEMEFEGVVQSLPGKFYQLV